MNSDPPRRPSGEAGTIPALIATLHETSKRLEELTAGEVDTVADREGRIFLLPGAQEQLRRIETERLAAVLDCLPAHVAMLDAQGVIVSVNASWRVFAEANALRTPDYAVGADYVATCESAQGRGCVEAPAVAAGIRAVLEGRARGYSVEYSCHSPTEKRWFLLSVSPLSAEGPRGAVVMHLDISERTGRDEELRRFRAAMEVSGDAILLIDRSSLRYIDVNQTLCDLVGYSREEMLRMTPMDLCSASRGELERDYDSLIADSAGSARPASGAYRRKDGTMVEIEIRRRALLTEAGWVIVGIARDVTERRIAEVKILRLNRVYAVLSGINGAMVHIRDRGELFREVCRIAVDEGGYTLARMVEIDPEGHARTVASSEADSTLFQAMLDEHNADPGRSASLIALVLAKGEAVISNDVAVDPRIPNRATLTRDGSYALAVLPILVAKRVAALVVLRARKTGAFTPEELRLLQELTGNISVSLEHLDNEHRLERQAADKKRTDASLLRFAEAMDATADAIYLVDRASMKIVHVNAAACRMQGKTRDELLALTPGDMLSIDTAELERTYDAIIGGSGTAAPLELLRPRGDGASAWMELRRHARHGADGWMIVSVVRDITARKHAEAAAVDAAGEQKLLTEELGFERARLVAAQRVAKIGSWETDLADMSVIWSEESHRIHETDPANFRPTHEAFLRLVHPDDRARVNEAFVLSLRQRGTTLVVHRLLLPNGRIKHVEERWRIQLDAGQKPVRAIGTCQDITERRETEERVASLARVRAVLSGINALIVRARDRDGLFRDACRVALDAGGFRMAWIGMVDHEAKRVVPIAVAGAEPGFLEQIRDRFSLDESGPDANTMSVRAIRSGRAVVSNDIRLGSPFHFTQERLAQGILSVAVLPLLVAGAAEGVLVIYSSEKDFFHSEERKLLTELAGHIAFAIDHIGKQARLDFLAYYDALTGLANRSRFLERIEKHLRIAAGESREVVVFLVDLERFKNINDSLGRPAGDALLRQVADWLTRATGDAQLVARLGADLFAVILPKVSRRGDVARLLEKWMGNFLGFAFGAQGAGFRIAARVGAARFPGDGEDADTLLKNAEAALKSAKKRGERYLFYAQNMNEGASGRLTLENQLREALEKEQFVLHYQPKINLASGKLTSAEALIRWNDPRTGLVPPGRFIPMLEETGLIYDVGRWALRRAIADYLRWRAAGLPAVRIAVNVSPLQLRNRGFVEEIRQVVGVDARAAEGLELEITESLIMEDVQHSISSLEVIRAMNVSIAIDDFGTGFSSLSYLAKLSVDTLKIDRSFVVDMTVSPDGLSLVSTIINLAHSLKLKVVAEGVETEEQSRLLRLLGCDEMQGFLYSRPVPAAEFEAKFLQPPAG